jgi:RES domain-containing protein
VWRVTDDRWLAAVATGGGSERVAGQRGDPETAMALVDERAS